MPADARGAGARASLDDPERSHVMTESFDAQVPELEVDETVPPRPEEDVADVARSVPDPGGHGGQAAAGEQAAPLDG